MDDSARMDQLPDKRGAAQAAPLSHSPPGRPPLPPPPAPAAAEAPAQADGEPDIARKSGWAGARTVLQAVRATGRFRTLRDLVDTDAFIDPGRLVFLKRLGEGAFAEVQLAELRPAEGSSGASGGGAAAGARQVAVKTLRQELLADPAQIELFVREVELLRKLRNRSIVEFVGCSWQRASLDGSGSGEASPPQLFYVQEYCAGGSLGDLVRRQMASPFKKMYSDADALRWCLDVARALAYLHEARPVVIHRDLKLENVMLTGALPAQAAAKLGDFGLARLTPPAERQKRDRLTKLLSQPRGTWDDSARNASAKFSDRYLDRVLTSTTSRSLSSAPPSLLSSKSTASGLHVSTKELTGKTGSFGYMAPEVSREQQYNSAADIFSLGMCMYNLFCRTIPTLQILLNGDESHLEMYAARVADGYRPPMLSNVPASVAAVIEACWKGRAELRPSAREVAARLEAIQATGDCSAAVGSSGAGGGCCSVM